MASALRVLHPPAIRVSCGPAMPARAVREPVGDLLPRVAAGDATATRELIEAYGDLVWSLARRFDPSEAEDAVQEVFLDLWKTADRFDPERGSESTFIAMVTRRRLIDRQRRAKRRPIADGSGEVPDQEDPQPGADTSTDAATAARALGKLRREQRRVLELSTVDGLSHGEIATQTGMPLGTVKAHARRGLMAIRVALFGPPKEGEP